MRTIPYINEKHNNNNNNHNVQNFFENGGNEKEKKKDPISALSRKPTAIEYGVPSASF